jgi:hypothetical protein
MPYSSVKVRRVCPHEAEVHARKWKLYAATQDTAFKTDVLEEDRPHLLKSEE